MKKLLTALAVGMVMMSCGNGATDGDARTDTTALPPDTMMNHSDTSDHVNRNFGTAPTDTSKTMDSIKR